MRRLASCALLVVLLASPLSAQRRVATPGEEFQDPFPPLPRWNEAGTPYDPSQPLQPYALHVPRLRPTSGLIASPPEYSPSRGVIFKYSTTSWPSVVVDCVKALTADADHDDIAYVVVTSASQQTSATSAFTAAGADMSKVQFTIQPGDSVWLRDYGPHFIWQGGALAIVDSHYYPTRPNDNFIPTLLGDDYFRIPTYDMGLYYSGGNFQPGPDRSAFITSLIYSHNTPAEGFDTAAITALYNKFQGIDTLHIMPQLPTSVDATGHIDMWLYLVDEDTCIISEFKPGSNATAIQITNDAVPYMQNLGFEVYRPQAWVTGGVHYTYTNAFRVNDRILVPIYGPGNSSYNDEDADALSKWQAAAGPNVEIIPINCYSIIPAAGAIHCIVMQVPRFTAETPAVHVAWPDGGQLLPSGTTQTIRWLASDTNNAAIPTIDLYYSIDGGNNWQFIASTTNVGTYAWTVPNVVSTQCKIRVLAHSADGDTGENTTAGLFRIAPADRSIYDFSTGAGTDKFVYGYQTSSWSAVDQVRKPVTAQISPANYLKLAGSDATGGDTDANRYIAPTPSSGYESTHVVEITPLESPADIDDIEVLWEGYADNCTQTELYVWDYVAGQWCDGAGNYGQNAYIDSFAGNRDGFLRGNIRAGFARYVGPGGKMTFLVYADRTGDETFHDYFSVAISRIALTLLPGDMNCDGSVNGFDITGFTLALSDPDAYGAAFPACDVLNADANGDGTVNGQDIEAFVNLLGG